MLQGPLDGLRIVEFGGIGPGPFCGMLLADLGADVVRVDRPGEPATPFSGTPFAVTERGRRSIALDLKNAGDVATALALLTKADACFEGFRPGTMERLGLGPDAALERNPRLVYGRMTGWGQDGPLAQAVGHDINYIALSGALDAIGPPGQPIPPLNLVGDYGGGALYLAFGLLAAILHAQKTGHGQVVDCAMSDGAASLMAMFYGLSALGQWGGGRGGNLLDGGAPFYGTYQCADGRWIALGAFEPQFYRALRDKLGLDDPAFDAQLDQRQWPELKQRVTEIVATRSQAEWCEILEGSDACFAPVLGMADAPHHPHNVARGTFVEVGGVTQPAPAPRFSATPGAIRSSPPALDEHRAQILADWGIAGA